MRSLSAVSVLFLCACAGNAPQPGADWHVSQAEARKLAAEARYREALVPARQELAGAQRVLSADAPELADALMDLAYVERESGAYADAAIHYRQALDLRRAKFGAESVQAAESQEALARDEYLQADLPAAIPDFKAALAIQERLLPADAPALALTLADYGRCLTDYNDYDAAKPLLDRALAMREKAPGPGQLDLAYILNQQGFFAIMNGDDDGAAKLLQRNLALLDVPGGQARPELAYALDLSANVDLDQSHFADAGPKLERSLAIMTRVYGPDHQEVANALNDLARLYDDEADYTKAEDYYDRSIATYSRAVGEHNVNMGSVIGNLAQMQSNRSKYREAEANFKRAIAIDESGWTHDKVNMGFDYSNLAQLYRELGLFEQAGPLMLKSLALFEKNLPPDHPYILVELNNLGELYTEQGKDAEAETYLKRVIAANEKSLSPDDPVLATDYNNLAEVYEDERKYPEAEALYSKAVAINRKTLGPEHAMTAQFTQNLANLYDKEGKFKEAGALFPYALRVFSKAYGPDHVMTANMEFNYAFDLYHKGDWKKADPLFDRYFESEHRFFLQQYPYMTEHERLQMLAGTKEGFPSYFSYVTRYHEEDPALAGKMYDILLWQKGLVGNSIAALRAKIAASGDPQAIGLLARLSDLKTQVATLLNSPGPDHAAWQAEVTKLQSQADGTEKQLMARSSALSQEQALEKVTWKDVQKALKPGEAAVEFVHFNYNRGGGPTGIYYYVALVVTQETRGAPVLVLVGKAPDLEADPVADYANRIRKFGADAAPGKATFYSAFWQPLLPALGGANRVYLAADGVLNQASLGIVADGQGKLLMERYDLRLVTSTRDVLRPAYAGSADSAVLVGGPEFDLASKDYLAAVSSLGKPAQSGGALLAQADVSDGLPMARGSTVGKCPLPDSGVLCPLPGAAAEVGGIDSELTAARWQAQRYSGAQALEEAVKQVRHPRVLHLATHGFFLPDQAKVSEDPMLRSGLYLAGADNTLLGVAPPPGADDGVLTAYEATQLDLEGTELVVLSACDTGLGTAKNGEGVFGLNRALQEAGAQAVMMSMWSVPDQETRELMQLFYKNWLRGMEKHEALRQAELAERAVVTQRYGHDLPYYWGAFVMVGR